MLRGRRAISCVAGGFLPVTLTRLLRLPRYLDGDRLDPDCDQPAS